MNLSEFEVSTELSEPPPDLPAPLLALWHDRAGNWKRAHGIVQDLASRDAFWVHAYLHRQEGDYGNASYWYRRARRPVPAGAPLKEWRAIASRLLEG